METNIFVNELKLETETKQESIQMYEEMIRAIGNIILAKDKNVFEHTSRVVYYAKALAKELGWDNERLQWIEIGGFLHDIGKIGIPDSILNKRGALTKEEFEYIRKHPEIGADIIRGISFLRNAVDAVLTHQERYDGKGYPRGLKGEEIPEVGRILAIADAFDAMTSDRSYRKGMDKKRAIEELKRNAGLQFDPVFIKIFCDLLEREDGQLVFNDTSIENKDIILTSKMIDYTCLKSDTTEEKIRHICEEAIMYNFCTVCVNPVYVKLASNILKGTGVGVTSVIGFPLGASSKQAKAFEAKEAVKNGATEIDMVLNIGAIKDKNYSVVEDEIKLVQKTIGKKNILKVIIETNILNDEEKEAVCLIAKNLKVNFVKTSTGFVAGGAVVYDIELIKRIVGNEVGIKASGGIKTVYDAIRLIEAGATRIGTSSLLIIENEEKDSN